MTIQDYKNLLATLSLSGTLTKVTYVLDQILRAIQETMQERGLPIFAYHFNLPPDDVISRHYGPVSFQSKKWQLHDKPALLLVTTESVRSVDSEESVSTFDRHYRILMRFVYPYHYQSEKENSLDTFQQLVDNFLDMFEATGRRWALDGEYLFVQRNALSVPNFGFAVYGEIVCHSAMIELDFTTWLPISSERLEITSA